jgi:HD domain
MLDTPLRTDREIVRWAAGEAARLLGPLGDRWRHVRGVAQQARRIASILGDAEAPVLLAAAYLHDVGWAPELADTRFHPIDGARWVRSQGHDRLARLVAHHSEARFEAHLQGLGDELGEFEREDSPTGDALTYCDLTTGPTGEPITPVARWDEIERRYGPNSIVVNALARSRQSLLAAVRRTERRIEGAGIQPR